MRVEAGTAAARVVTTTAAGFLRAGDVNDAVAAAEMAKDTVAAAVTLVTGLITVSPSFALRVDDEDETGVFSAPAVTAAATAAGSDADATGT